MTTTSLPVTEEPEVVAARDRTKHSLALYYRALCGQVCSLVPYDEGWSPWEHADTETTIWLPREAPLDDHAAFSADEWYQVAMTHRAMHHTLGTFDLDLDRDEPLFARLRPTTTEDGRAVPSLRRLPTLFGHSVLGIHVFATCEDLRIDAATDRLLPGLAAPARGVHHGALHDRPQPATLFPRAAAVEALVRYSLGGSVVWAATAMHEPIARVVAVARHLRDPRATAESSVEAALRICDVLAGLSTGGTHRSTHQVSFEDLETPLDDAWFDVGSLAHRLQGAEGFAAWYHPVAYRDWPGPRYVGAPAADASLEAFLPQVAQASTAPAPEQIGDRDAGSGTGHHAPAQNARGVDTDATPDVRPLLPFTGDEPWADLETPLTARTPAEFVYPEWDCYTQGYRPDFTRLRVGGAPVKRADHSHYRALARYGHLVGRLVRELERVRPDGRTVSHRAPHGDDLDLDACVDAVLDLRTGVEPSDRVFTDLRQRRRDVAVAFALDLSASTAVALPPDPEAPGTVRSILDLQRDAVSLVAQALERVGDDYGVYGFSGSGRDDVRLSVVKDVEEHTTPSVWHRLGGLTPDHTTRMAPAIRHLARRLGDVEAATKILFVISDGRPFDIDYGQQYGEEAMLGYALADTARALGEAEELGVHPYLVTIDPDGADYLGGVCDPGSYHVIADARQLPEALASLYSSVRGTT